MLRKDRRDSRTFRALAPLVVATLRQQRQVYPAGRKVRRASDVVVASYNIHKCVGRDGVFDPRRTAAVIREIDADIIALQEVDRRFGKRAGVLDLAGLHRDCGLVPVPIVRTRSSHGWHGNLVLVREDTVAQARRLKLPGAEPRGGLVVDLSLPSGPLRLIAAHLGLLRHSRTQQVEAILAAAEVDDGRPVLLLGDLNEWRLGERSALRALEPAFGPLQASVASFPSNFPIWSLDRILANPHDMIAHIEVHSSTLARIASDHLPVKAAVNLRKRRRQIVARDAHPVLHSHRHAGDGAKA